MIKLIGRYFVGSCLHIFSVSEYKIGSEISACRACRPWARCQYKTGNKWRTEKMSQQTTELTAAPFQDKSFRHNSEQGREQEQLPRPPGQAVRDGPGLRAKLSPGQAVVRAVSVQCEGSHQAGPAGQGEQSQQPLSLPGQQDGPASAISYRHQDGVARLHLQDGEDDQDRGDRQQREHSQDHHQLELRNEDQKYISH